MSDAPVPMPAPVVTPLPAPLIELDDASVRRGDRQALRGVSLHVPVGRHTAILGPNGCGKSTFIQLITRQLYPMAHDDGRPAVRLFGEHLWDVREIRARLGIVTGSLHDELASVPALEVEDAVLGAFQARLAAPHPETVTEAMRAQAALALARAQASHLRGRLYRTLSTGEARRVMIARALVHRPPALLLDEPTTGLDPVARQHLLNTLRELAREGVALLLVTHHLEEMIPEIEHLVLLRDGQVVADGPRTELLTADWLSRTFGAPLRLHAPDGNAGQVFVDVSPGPVSTDATMPATGLGAAIRNAVDA